MLWILSIIFLILPCLEIGILIHLTFLMSLSAILLLSIITMIAGIWLIKGENISLWTLVQSELLNRRIPTQEIFDDLFIWCGGIFLIVPGLLTDSIGILILIPTIRQESILWLRNKIQKYLRSSQLN